MGVDSRKPPPLPAPTETDTNTPTELTTDLSKPGDEKSSYSIPEDGTPVTIRTRGHKANRSQTSLLIEYFEGGKSQPSGSITTERKPSVRVRLTSSKKSKGDHLQVTETKGSRKASLTRRIPLNEPHGSREIELLEGEDTHSLESYASATEESNVSRNPIDIEIDRGHRRRRPASPLIPSAESYQPGNPSEISAIPTDSFLDGTGPGGDVKRDSSPSRGKALAAAAGAGALAGAALHEMGDNKSRSSRGERVKISDKSKDKSDRKRRSKSRTSSLSEQTDEIRSPRRRPGRSHQESTISGADSSVLSSNLSPSHRSLDAHSMRSGTSKSSINNPKLLETVEDAIRRLILPELSALKREQSKRESRRGSLTSTGTSASRDDLSTDRRRSSGQRAAELSKESPKLKERRNREARRDYEDISLRSPRHDSFDADYQEEEAGVTTPRRSNGLLKAAAAGAAGVAAAKGLSAVMDDRSQPEERKHRERRRRRTESARSRSLGREKYAEEYDDDYLTPAPPMPLMSGMSDLNPSEMTRTSILSAETDRPHSASEEFVHETSRGVVSANDPPTPSRTPVNPLQDSLGTRHANISHGDLTALPRGNKDYVEEYETDEFGHKVPIDHGDEYHEEVSREVSEPVDYPEDGYNTGYYSTQDVPPPLKYVPYQAGARGLSPIPSVSGYTEGGSEAPQPRDSRSVHSASEAYSALDRSPEHRLHQSHSGNSLNSVPSNMRSRDFDQLSMDERSLGSAGAQRNTMYTDGSQSDQMLPGQTTRGFGANPSFVHPPTGVESAVASLVDGSMLEPESVLTSGSGHEYGNRRDSTLSYEDQDRHLGESSRGLSPEKMSVDSRREFEEERRSTPGSRSHDQSQGFSEYEIDEHGRKVMRSKYRQSPTASEAAITAGAVGVVAAALKAAQEKKQATVEDAPGESWASTGSGIPQRNKSFKERTLEGREPRSTPAHSIDRMSFDEPHVKLGASGLPDLNDPMPEVGYVDDRESNASVVQDRLDGEHDTGHWSGRATPTQRSIGGYGQQETPSKDAAYGDRGLGISEAAGAAALGAAAGMVAAHSREPSQDVDDWHRTSEERKRDTLVTNPYEDASPIANPALGDNLLSTYNPNFHTGSPGLGQKYPDEGYMSNGPNRTPEPKGKAVDFAGPIDTITEDPFYVPKDTRHLSGMSHGMGSPFYDAATGAGIERIENKDIVALMQHLMVRDAQRSARDTEIVALLMNAAMEMRNSFREMKDLVQDTGDDMIFANVENTEKLQKAINGPRPYPGVTAAAGSRSIHSASAAGTLNDVDAKKKNLWKRALQGLSARGTSDLTRIEDMLMQLLGEVDVLKTQTAAPPSSGAAPGQSFENLQPEGQYEQDRGYEPEGASTASHASQSGHLAQAQSRGQPSRLAEPRYSDHRISTVEEHDDEGAYDHPSPAADRTDPNFLAPSQTDAAMRGSSVPLETPPRTAQTQQPLSAENTPRTDRGKKHKSSSSSGWIPKISRWSNTTASSVGKAFRGSGGRKDAKYDDYQPPSRSGSSLASYEEHQYQHEPYAEDKLHTGFSDPSLQTEEQLQAQEQVDPSGPPPTNYMTPEDPKYQVHRNSLNLQHPQPRPGQTERFRTALEYSAQEFDTPMTPKSAEWAGSATSLHRLPQNNTQRYSNTSSAAAREAEYWPTSPTTGPPRPPKEPVDNAAAQTPPKASRASKLQKGSPLAHPGYTSNYTALAEAQGSPYGSPKLENRNLSGALGTPTRRPSGPRAMTPKTLEEEAAREERRRKRDTFGTVGSADTDTF